MLFANPHRLLGPYGPDLQAVLSIAQARQARAWLCGWDEMSPSPTPVWALTGLARQLGLGQISVKDESQRARIGSFKALGAPFALLCLIARWRPACRYPVTELLEGRHAAALQDLVVISATDGNHGRALAAAARSVGCRCVIVLHAQVSPERETPIAALGAEIVRITGNYDDSVREAARLAQTNGWQVVSDTSYPGYETVPRDVMQGYAVIADELVEGCDGPVCAYSHVILQGGVGGFAAGVASYLWQRFGAQRPQVIVAEPQQADCLLQSALAGRPSVASGSVDSVMAGLACGETSPLAWRFLALCADFFMTLPDSQAVAAMTCLARPSQGDVPILSGESGAAGLGALLCLAQQPGAYARVGLGPRSHVLLINTEGATAPALYEKLCGAAPGAVLASQAAWLQAQAMRA